MRKKLFSVVILSVAFVGAISLFAAPPAHAKGCPRNSHLVVCPTYSFCCPNNAFCVCLP